MSTVLIIGKNSYLKKNLISTLQKHKKNTLFTAVHPASLSKKKIDFQKPDWIFYLFPFLENFYTKKEESIPYYFENFFLPTLQFLRTLDRIQHSYRFFLASSIEVYEDSSPLNSSLDPILLPETTPCSPKSNYGFVLYLIEKALQEWQKKSANQTVLVGRFSSYLKTKRDLKHPLTSLFKAARVKKELLTSFYSLSDVQDLAKILPKLMEKTPSFQFEVFNIASPYILSGKDILSRKRAPSKAIKIREEKGQSSNIQGQRRNLDVTKLQLTLPQYPFQRVEQILKNFSLK